MAEHLVAWTGATFGVVGVALLLAGLTGAALACLVVALVASGAVIGGAL